MKDKTYKKKLLSVIIPAYQKEKTIKDNLLLVEGVLSLIRYDYEIICVVDGKKIDRTYQNAKKAASAKIKVVGYNTNKGKGYAVRYGMARARGDLIALLDAGDDIDPNGISMLLEHMEWYNADIIIGSKMHPVSQVDYPFIRRVCSFGYQFFVRLLFGLEVRDTQVGLKIFRRKVLRKVLPRLLVKRFAADVELLAVARRLGFKRIFEAPIKLNGEAFRTGSSVKEFKSLYKAAKGMFLDTLAVFYRLKILRYYDDNNKRKWVYDPGLDFRVNIG